MSHEELIDQTQTGATANPEIDSIWLTRTSIKPIVLAVAFTLTLIGLFAFRPLMDLGIIVAVITTIAWIADSRDESDELPLD